MTNYDKIKNMSIEEMHSFLVDIKQGNFEHVYIREWLGEKTKPVLSVVERMILENIDKEYKWIARDRGGFIAVFNKKPIKDDTDRWQPPEFTEWDYMSFFHHLFQFVKWEDPEPYNIEELLKGE